MAWRTSTPPPPAAAPAPHTRAPMTAHNALFLICFGMFLMATLLPVLMASLSRLFVLVGAVLAGAAATNPSDHSFALWINQQNEPRDLVPDASSVGVSKWFSAVYHTAKALMCNEPLTWRFHNALVFSVVHVPSRERWAFGVFGTWRWADEAGAYVTSLCHSPWVMKISRGGTVSSIEEYVVHGAGGRYGSSAGSSAEGLLRRRKVAMSSGCPTGFVNDDVATTSHQQIRAKAMQSKIKKDWKTAAVLFLEAAKVAGALLVRANYELEAAWCALEEAATYPSEQSDLVRKIKQLCDELASAGYFDEAARGLSELALRLKRKFPTECKTTELAKQVAALYVQAKNVAEAGGSVHNAAENGVRAAQVYADAGLWSFARKCFEVVGDIQRENEQYELANEAYGNAVLCRIGQLDMTGAENMLNRFTEYMGDTHRSSDMDCFLSSVLKAYHKWSRHILETAVERYSSSHRLAPWQKKLDNADLR
ncbi:unnamed protein product [Hyaloperonospora brassicae]|uniref:RxLR effector candidate protein n=1 Tax=Hyaloperonospora brassicae TaxID=162125 RepID=A0AAV0TC29_HYABA|nr:unnamed protein product [Hyaloperonospora brassicae]